MTAAGWPETEQEVREITATVRFHADAQILIAAAMGLISLEAGGSQGFLKHVSDGLLERYGPDVTQAMIEKYIPAHDR